MKYIFFLFTLALSTTSLYPRAITYEFNGGRFGDCLSTYCKAKWFSYKHHIPLLYKPFTYSDQLALDTIETVYNPSQSFSKIVKVKSEADITNNKDDDVLFVSNFYSQTPGLYEYGFQDAAFEQELKKLLSPSIAMPKMEKIENNTTVAVHVRKGGGFDQPLASDIHTKKPQQYADQIWPTKFPPDQYYIDQIKVVRKLIDPHHTLQVYLLTDDPHPATLAEKYAKELNDGSIMFTFREQNSHDTNVIEDFYIMGHCDCLIRSTSLFAKAAQLLGSHRIIMYPIHGAWIENKLIMNPVGITLRS